METIWDVIPTTLDVETGRLLVSGRPTVLCVSAIEVVGSTIRDEVAAPITTLLGEDGAVTLSTLEATATVETTSDTVTLGTFSTEEDGVTSSVGGGVVVGKIVISC